MEEIQHSDNIFEFDEKLNQGGPIGFQKIGLSTTESSMIARFQLGLRVPTCRGIAHVDRTAAHNHGDQEQSADK